MSKKFSHKNPSWLRPFSSRIFFLLALFLGVLFGNLYSEVHAAPVISHSPATINSHQISTKFSWAETNTGSNTSTANHHSLIHALINLFHLHNSHPLSVASDHSTQTMTKNTSVTPNPVTIPGTFLEKHPFLNEISHYIGEIFGPYSYKPSVKTEKNSAGKIPVIVVHGTWANGNWMSDIYHSLDKAGIPTYVSTFGTGGPSLAGLVPFIGGVAPTEKSEKQLADYIDKVQKETGASKVNLIGHSQGGLIIKDYIAHDTKNNIQTVIDLGATNHGTTENGASSLIYFFPKPIQNILIKVISSIVGPGATDQLTRSNFIQNLNRYPDTKAGIHYLVLSDKDDTTSTPYQNTYLKPVPGADVTNLEIHSLPGVTGNIAHAEIPLTAGVIDAVTQFIESKGEPNFHQSVSLGQNLVSRGTEKNFINRNANSLNKISPQISLLS